MKDRRDMIPVGEIVFSSDAGLLPNVNFFFVLISALNGVPTD